ncbi:unnamed protein product [Sphagnum jensenii]|uniref:Transmembrane protein n=1 Tax=Sphagnum jensenii TaxID=128206 RepID=A0ABP1A6H8_9BRYO
MFVESFSLHSPWQIEICGTPFITLLIIGVSWLEELWMSCGGAVRPELLLLFRALAVAYLLPQLLYNIVKDGVSGYFFYTQWTFTLLILYFSLALRVSVDHFVNEKFNRSLPARIESPDFGDEQVMLDEDDEVEGAGVRSILQNGKDRIAGYVTQAVFQAVLPAVLLTDMVYWCLLVPFVLPKTTRHTFIDVNMHAVNALLLLTEFGLNSLRFPWFRIGYIILWSASYTYFQWILFTTGLSHKWPYPFMDVETPWAPAWYLFIIVFHGICFALCLLLALGKQSIWSRFNFPTTHRMSF